MRDSYEPPADHRPWQTSRPDWAVSSRLQGLPVQSGQPALFPADALARPPDLTGHGLSQDHAPRLAYDPYQGYPAPADRPAFPGRTMPFWRQGWADYDPYSAHPVWPGHPAYAARNAGLHRLSKLTWRAAEVSAVIVIGFVAFFARTAHGATSTGHAKPNAKASAHAAAAHHAQKRHKHHHHHHHASGPAPGLAPPQAPPAAPAAPAAAPAPPPPPPPPPPVTTSGGSGGGGG